MSILFCKRGNLYLPNCDGFLRHRQCCQKRNFFIERYGNLDKLKDGSVWKSSLDKINWFVYYYVPDRTFFWFKVEELKDFMEENMAKFQQRKIRNIGWEALGFLVPREEVRHLIKKEDKF